MTVIARESGRSSNPGVSEKAKLDVSVWEYWMPRIRGA
jgi:hypothetical protein